MRKIASVLCVVAILAVVGLLVPQFLSAPVRFAAQEESKQLPDESVQEMKQVAESSVQIRNTVIPVELARTSLEQQRGLSGRATLDPNKGMLFIFTRADYYKFWMPDMQFPIDIIWINDNTVVDISANVSNAFDPINPTYYSPRTPAQYVLEVNSGFAAVHSINIGDSVELNTE